jgi:hypothetical protein
MKKGTEMGEMGTGTIFSAGKMVPVPISSAVVIMARQPVAGRVKTRLAAALGDEGACAAYRVLLRATLEAVAEAPCNRYVFLPPGETLAEGDGPIDRFRPGTQRGPDLGARLAAAFDDLFAAGYERVVALGSDCPDASAAHVTRALEALATRDAAFGPAVDGGYWLVGLRAPGRDVFTGIPWSTPEVWAATRERLVQNGWSHALLPVLEDVDDAASWDRWRARPAVRSPGPSARPT